MDEEYTNAVTSGDWEKVVLLRSAARERGTNERLVGWELKDDNFQKKKQDVLKKIVNFSADAASSASPAIEKEGSNTNPLQEIIDHLSPNLGDDRAEKDSKYAYRVAHASALLAEYRMHDYHELWWKTLVRRRKLADKADRYLLDIADLSKGGGWLKTAARIFRKPNDQCNAENKSTETDIWDVVDRFIPEWKNLSAKADAAKSIFLSAKALCDRLSVDAKTSYSDWIRELREALLDLKQSFEGQDHIHGIIANLINAHALNPAYTIDTFALNMVIMGPPGAGKTTISRKIETVLQRAGLLIAPIAHEYDDALVEVTRADMVGEHLGETAPKVQRLVDSAYGKMLFLDEASSLVTGSDDQYGKEALNKMVALMSQNQGKVSFVFAGYKNDMQGLMDHNQRLRSRFEHECVLEELTVSQLVGIFFKEIAGKEGTSTGSYSGPIRLISDEQLRLSGKLEAFFKFCRDAEAYDNIQDLLTTQAAAVERISRFVIAIASRRFWRSGGVQITTDAAISPIVARALWQFSKPRLEAREAQILVYDELEKTFGNFGENKPTSHSGDVGEEHQMLGMKVIRSLVQLLGDERRRSRAGTSH